MQVINAWKEANLRKAVGVIQKTLNFRNAQIHDADFILYSVASYRYKNHGI